MHVATYNQLIISSTGRELGHLCWSEHINNTAVLIVGGESFPDFQIAYVRKVGEMATAHLRVAFTTRQRFNYSQQMNESAWFRVLKVEKKGAWTRINIYLCYSRMKSEHSSWFAIILWATSANHVFYQILVILNMVQQYRLKSILY